ncbi:MAG: PDZ domain-containing protein, partial [Pirellulales bacterium]|nr:PDZ domain-containing protein [Pirellulales bacterium]
IGFGGGFLGVMLGQTDKGPKIERVVPKSAAADAGLKEGDVVIKVADQRMKSREQMVETVRDYKPGEVVTLTIIRDGEESSVRVTLGRRDMSSMRAGRLHAMNLMGGPISQRRTNFPNVLQHDTVLRPEQCGGPICDLDGNVVGINIARAGRVMSYAVPAETIVSVLPQLKSGELAPKPTQIASVEKKAAPKESKPELEAVLEEIRKAESELRESQEKLRKAREALEKAREEGR